MSDLLSAQRHSAEAKASANSRRIDDLIASMTLEEKIGQLVMESPPEFVTGPGPGADLAHTLKAGLTGSILNVTDPDELVPLQRIAIEESRLGIPPLCCFDVLHGYRTIVPIPLGEAAAFDPQLWEETAAMAAGEAVTAGIALTFAPMLDVCRDPRWGRIAEGPGEDAWLARRFASAKVRGFQGRDAARLLLASTAKHVGAYGAVTAGREYASADISLRELEEVHLPAFQAAVEAGVAAIMPTLIDIGGIPVTCDRALLHGLIRERWGFDGVIISDYGAVANLVNHGVAADLVEAAALALRATVDIEMMGGAFRAGLPLALSRGLVTLQEIDTAVRRVLRLKERLGLLDRPLRRAPATIAPAAPSGAARALARRSAARSVVLLHNSGSVLPLSSRGEPITLIGPFAQGTEDVLGPWSGLGRPEEAVGLYDALRRALPQRQVLLAGDGNPLALPLPAQSGPVVLCLGEVTGMSGEAASRAEPVLPAWQAALAEKVMALGRPTILILWSGRPLVATELITRADAALAAWFPGTEGGTALAELLIGDRDATGRLPVSWPASIGQIPVFYGQRPTGRPYDPAIRYSSQYIDAPVAPLFPFGHGLSYTSFEITLAAVSPDKMKPGGAVTVRAKVRNTGDRSGEQTVFLFIRDLVAAVARPVLELRGVERIALAPGAEGEVTFTLTDTDLAYLGPDMKLRTDPGAFDVFVGPSADFALLARGRFTRLP